MKRSQVLALICACTLAFALFGLSACGGSDASDSSNQTEGSTASSTANTDSSESEESSDIDPNANPDDLSDDDVRKVFEQITANMSEFYHGSTPADEQIYYAGGADGDNAILTIILPDSSQSVIFVGPATVEEGTNKITITDEATGSAISVFVTSNDDGTISFAMGEGYGATVMAKCSSADIVDALTQVIAESRTAATTEQTD